MLYKGPRSKSGREEQKLAQIPVNVADEVSASQFYLFLLFTTLDISIYSTFDFTVTRTLPVLSR